ncbi:hypothetical protein BGZ57DRAFT_269311 [Hyaloscypha finlandica]|nr:hypothetical protein BGZ57DRAFT_269311 [Hyaloscypha finlandica]
MQSNTNTADQDVPDTQDRTSGRLSDTYVVRKTADAGNTEERCYICFEDWQIGDGMVRLRCCDHWLHEDCLSKSVLDGQCPTCRIWLASDEYINNTLTEKEAHQQQQYRRFPTSDKASREDEPPITIFAVDSSATRYKRLEIVDIGARGGLLRDNLLNSSARVLLIYSSGSLLLFMGPCPPADSVLCIWAAERSKSSGCPPGVDASTLNRSPNMMPPVKSLTGPP